MTLNPFFLSLFSERNIQESVFKGRQICVDLNKSANGYNRYSSDVIYIHSQSSISIIKRLKNMQNPNSPVWIPQKRTAHVSANVSITCVSMIFGVVVIFTQGANNCGEHLMHRISTLFVLLLSVIVLCHHFHFLCFFCFLSSYLLPITFFLYLFLSFFLEIFWLALVTLYPGW